MAVILAFALGTLFGLWANAFVRNEADKALADAKALHDDSIRLVGALAKRNPASDGSGREGV